MREDKPFRPWHLAAWMLSVMLLGACDISSGPKDTLPPAPHPDASVQADTTGMPTASSSTALSSAEPQSATPIPQTDGSTATDTPAPASSPSASSSLSASSSPLPSVPTGKEVVGYLPTWRFDAWKTTCLDHLSQINIAFVNPDTAGKFQCETDADSLLALVDAAHKKGVKVLASLGGAGGCANYPALVTDPDKRKDLTKELFSFLEKNGLDGVDLDIEGDVDSSFWATYEEWVGEIRQGCDARKLWLTTAVGNWYAGRITAATYALFDRVGVMAYDDTVDPANHSTLRYAEFNLKTFGDGCHIPREKLLLGVPFYGYGYTKDGQLNWADSKTYAELLALDPNVAESDVYQGYGYNGVETLKAKCLMAKEYAGVMIWELSQDAPEEDALLTVIHDTLFKD